MTMPTIFLSYARGDLDQARRITEQLTAEGVTVWRDQERLYLGKTWPKALGEAIAASDALLLLWSSRAAESTFVELEWCTAMALKKSILPCLLDQTPLPPSLAAIEAAEPYGIAAAARKLLIAPADETKSPDQLHTDKVVRELAEIGAAAPAEVLEKAKAVFSQSGWKVQGPLYQAGGDIRIETLPPRKPRVEKWQAWVAIVVSILTAVSLGAALVRSYLPARQGQATSISQSTVFNAQPLAGLIVDETGKPLTNVRVSVLLDGKELKTDYTDSLGHYSVRIDGPREAEVTLLTQKDGYPLEKRYTHLGNAAFNFKMGRKQP